MKAKLATIAWFLLLASLVFPTGCRSGNTKDVLKVGSILGLTGDNASYGQKMLRGLELARDEINSSGGILGRVIELSIEDSQFDPTKALVAYRKLTGLEGLRVIVGITGSRNAIPVCDAAKADDVVIIDALSSAPKISTQCGPNYFRIMASDALAGQYIADWAGQSGATRQAIVYMEDDWGTSYRDSVLGYLAERGSSGIVAEGIEAGTRDFRVQVEKLRQAEPDTIYLLLYAKEAAAFVQQLRQARVNATVYGSDNISSTEFVSAGIEVVEDVRVAMPAPARGPSYEDFVRRYQTKFNEDPDANVIKSYDALMLAASVIKEAGMEPSKVATRLASQGFQYVGVSGLVQFDHTGDLVNQEYTRMVYHGGKLVPMS